MNAGAATPAMASATDAELVDAVRGGDEHAFEELYRRYRSQVFAFVRGRVRDDGRAEDLTQEAFLSALRRLRATESEVGFRPWIYEIARNATIDHFRRSARAQEVSVDTADQLRRSDYLRLVSPWGPERELAAKQDLEILRGALEELSDRHERILVMREFEGLSYQEIGERMQLTRPGVESTLFRARRRLQTEYAELETGRRCTAVRGAMRRVAEEAALRGDRALVMRHVRRCATCRATASELGLLPDRPSRASRAAAVLALPFLPSAFATKAAAVVAAVAVAGGGTGFGLLGGSGGDGHGVPSAQAASAPPSERPSAPQALHAPAVAVLSSPAGSTGTAVVDAASARLAPPSPSGPDLPPEAPSPADVEPPRSAAPARPGRHARRDRPHDRRHRPAAGGASGRDRAGTRGAARGPAGATAARPLPSSLRFPRCRPSPPRPPHRSCRPPPERPRPRR